MASQVTPAAQAAQMRTTIRETSSGTVRLTAIDPYSGELMDETYYVPNNGGYVRVIERGYGTDNPQVCGELGRRGYTLEATPASLLGVIRAEWRARRRSYQREQQKLYGWR